MNGQRRGAGGSAVVTGGAPGLGTSGERNALPEGSEPPCHGDMFGSEPPCQRPPSVEERRASATCIAGCVGTRTGALPMSRMPAGTRMLAPVDTSKSPPPAPAPPAPRRSIRCMRSTSIAPWWPSWTNGTSSRPSSAMLAYRCSGAFARQRRITSCSSRGAWTIGEGASTATFTHISENESASNGLRPSTSSYSTVPSDHMSVRPSTARADRICSGDMYAGVPSSDCVCVRRMSVPIDDFEIPKSSTLISAVPSGRHVTNRFAGLTSRWTMPIACASASASQVWSTSSTAHGTGSRPRSTSSAPRSWPSRNSMTMYGMPDSNVPTSDTRATYSLLSFTAACASRMNRSVASRSSDTSCRSILIATRSLSCRCVHSATTPMPPWPRIDSTRYFPRKTVPMLTASGAGRGVWPTA